MTKKEKKSSKIQMFFLVIFIPSLFAVVLFSIILNMVGIDLIGGAKQIGSGIPILSEYIEEDELIEQNEKVNVGELEALLSTKQQEIEYLSQQLESRDETIMGLEEDILLKEGQIETLEMSNEAVTQELREIARTYEAMSPKNAAAILSELDTNEALLHLSQLSTNARAGILAKMDPDRAAILISGLSD